MAKGEEWYGHSAAEEDNKPRGELVSVLDAEGEVLEKRNTFRSQKLVLYS